MRLAHPHLLILLGLSTACPLPSAGDVGGLEDGGSGSGESGSNDSTTGTTDASESGESGDTDGARSCEDPDADGVPFTEDNSDLHYNPSQGDIDGDGLADVFDLCPTVAGDEHNTADSDSDGVGNDCDVCRQTLDSYNDGAELAGVPAHMRVRNSPSQADADEDGIGDACDNCVWTPNCEDYGVGQPYRVGDPIAYADADLCQRDTNADLVGDACEGMTVRPNAAGPIGFGDAEDFDQDGVTNLLDTCPRNPIAEADMVACTGPDACGDDRTCDDGWCNHVDSDADGVGDECDTCDFVANQNQVTEGGSFEDDPDEDFVGSACETAEACAERRNARPYAFHRVQALGNCCTQRLLEATEEWDDPSTPQSPDVAIGDLLDARGCESPIVPGACPPIRALHPGDPLATLPLRTYDNCPEEQVDGVWVCRQLQPSVEAAPGVLSPPPGCVQALFDAGTNVFDNTIEELTLDDFAGDAHPADALWQHQCFLPQFDEDHDGLGDACDLCVFAYDPANVQYVDDDGKFWPDSGAFCNGDFYCD